MTDEIKSVVDFSCLKECIVRCRTTSKYVAEATGLAQGRISRIITGWDNPKTDVLAKLAWALKVPVSEIVKFKEIEPNKMQQDWLSTHKRQYKPSENATGELSYAPLWELINGYLEKANEGKEDEPLTVKDLLDSIEPYGRAHGFGKGLTDEARELSMKARGFSGDYNSQQKRVYKAKGLTPETRTKLRNDRPLSIRMIYDICKKLGCPIDWVLSYK